MLSKFIKIITREIANIPGWRTNRKIIVIESDDWGSIRMPSVKVFKSLQDKGVDITSGDISRYNLFDTLATVDDLSLLFDILAAAKDKNGNSCIFTPLSLVANPDFEKIKAGNFKEYYYEPFTETLKRYPGCENSFSLWTEGVKHNIFIPQFHGREHLNVQVWLKALQNNDPHTRIAFESELWGFNSLNPKNISYQAAFDLYNPSEIDYQKEVIASGLKLFEKLHGYKASFFVPPNGPFNEILEETAFTGGIRYMYSTKIHHEPQGYGKFKNKFHYLGQKNKLGQHYLMRNCFFEPSQKGRDWVSSCIDDISIAFKWHKPAVISSHRVNFIGALNPSNRDNGLRLFKELLDKIKQRYPDVEFMSSSQLGDTITNG
ncbi:MAG: polysaccharide (de)acetylase [Bacteroidota bacterium]